MSAYGVQKGGGLLPRSSEKLSDVPCGGLTAPEGYQRTKAMRKTAQSHDKAHNSTALGELSMNNELESEIKDPRGGGRGWGCINIYNPFRIRQLFSKC